MVHIQEYEYELEVTIAILNFNIRLKDSCRWPRQGNAVECSYANWNCSFVMAKSLERSGTKMVKVGDYW
jgi:hypothetical protein